MRIHRVLVLGTALVAGAASAQEMNTERTLTLAGTDAARATIEDFEWLIGSWHGEAFGATAEEMWSPAAAGTMIGTFKLYNGDQVMFYEFMVLLEDGDSVTLRLKHFNSDMVGWETREETVDFPLVRLTEDTAYFDGLTFARRGADLIDIYLAIGDDEGTREEHIVYRRRHSERTS